MNINSHKNNFRSIKKGPSAFILPSKWDSQDSMLICVCGYVLSIFATYVSMCVCSSVRGGVRVGGRRTFDDTHSVHSCAPDVLCRVTSDSHLLSLRMVNISTGLIQGCWPADSPTPLFAFWLIRAMTPHSWLKLQKVDRKSPSKTNLSKFIIHKDVMKIHLLSARAVKWLKWLFWRWGNRAVTTLGQLPS